MTCGCAIAMACLFASFFSLVHGRFDYHAAVWCVWSVLSYIRRVRVLMSWYVASGMWIYFEVPYVLHRQSAIQVSLKRTANSSVGICCYPCCSFAVLPSYIGRKEQCRRPVVVAVRARRPRPRSPQTTVRSRRRLSREHPLGLQGERGQQRPGEALPRRRRSVFGQVRPPRVSSPRLIFAQGAKRALTLGW